MENSKMHWITLIATALLIVGIFWMMFSSSYYYYSAGVLGIIIIALNATMLIAFVISIIASILGFSQTIKEKLSTRLTIIPLIIGLILLANSIAIYAFLIASRIQ
jgi:heme/copper-type cytochrome/quinol oxidase subunit 4